MVQLNGCRGSAVQGIRFPFRWSSQKLIGSETESVVSLPMASTSRGVTRVLILADAPVLRRGLIGMVNETAGLQAAGTHSGRDRSPGRGDRGAGCRSQRDAERLPGPASPVPADRDRGGGHLGGPGGGQRGPGRGGAWLSVDEHLSD